ncbi:MAG: amidohydrolase family protein [Planctomycetes bacterium]|nr:amidohydrolase family protein [Planctomycetota bacterium]
MITLFLGTGIVAFLGALAPQDAPASAPATSPASAPVRQKGEYPSELDEDRIPRLKTGGNVLIQNATVLPVTSPKIDRASVLVRGGKIAAIGNDLSVPEGVAVIDGRGLFVVPGSVDCHSHLAIAGDVNEGSDSITADCRIADVIDPDDLAIYRALAGGSTSNRLLHGSANAIGGEHAVIKLKWKRTASDLRMDDAPRGIKFALGENPKRSNGRTPGTPLRYPATRLGVEAVIRRAFDEARDLLAQRKEDLERIGRGEAVPPRRRDLRLETLAAILSGEVGIHSHCYRSDEILMLLDLCESYGVKVRTLQHVLEGFKVAPEIVRHGAGASTFSDWWAYKVEAYDATPYNAALMMRAGASVSLNSDSAELVRRLHLDAAKTMRYGMLGVDEALSTVTLEPARQLGLEKRLGSIEVGKDADLAIFDGHPLEARAKCMFTLVDGEVEFERRDLWSQYIADLPPAPARSAAPASFADATPWSPAPKVAAPAQPVIAIVNGTVIPVDGAPMENATVLVKDGLIAAVGRDVAIPQGATTLDAKGFFVYPGLIDAGTPLGLREIGSVPATNDGGEGADGFQPDLRASRAVHAASEHIPVARANGITTALVPPFGGTIAGQASLMHLDGWTAPEMSVVDALALVVEMPAQRADDPEKSDEENARERDKAYKNSVRALKIWMERAVAYSRGEHKSARDPKLEALAPYAAGIRPVLFVVNNARDAVGAVRFAEECKLRPILSASAHDIARIAGFLAERDVPVILGPVTRLPASSTDPYDTCYSAPRVLHAAGVRFAFAMGDSSNARNLPFQPGMAVAYGLPEDVALRSVTLDAARILGVDSRLGSITPGKIADLLISDGNPLEPRTRVKHLLIAGRPVNLGSKHTALYERYLERLAPELRAKAAPAR